MNENRFFADVDLPFHVWVREGDRWVLRAAPAQQEGADVTPCLAAGKPAGPAADQRRAA